MSKQDKNKYLKSNESMNKIEKLQTIKQSLVNIVPQANKYNNLQSLYRQKTSEYYKLKTKKTFYPSMVQNYQQMLKFQRFFQIYIKQQNGFNNQIKNKKEVQQETQNKQTSKINEKNEIFNDLLTLNIDQFTKLDVSQSFNCSKKQQKKYNQKRQIIFLPDIRQNNKTNTIFQTQSPIIFNCDYPLIDSPKSKFTGISRNNTGKSLINSLLNRKNSLKYNKLISQKFYEPSDIIEKMNKFNNGSKFKIQKFVISRKELKQIFCKKYGNEILTSYFEFNKMIQISQISNMLNQIYSMTIKEKTFLTFLTYDLNKDGYICQNDLFNLSKMIQIYSPIYQDINRIAKFIKQNNVFEYSNQIGIPSEILNCPQRKKYLQFVNDQKSFQSDCSRKSKVTNFNLIDNKIIKRKSEIKNLQQRQKRIQINFQSFFLIFQGYNSAFISDILIFLLTENNQTKQLQNQKKIKVKQKKKFQSLNNQNKSLEIKKLKASISCDNKINKKYFKNDKTRFLTQKSIKSSRKINIKALNTQPQIYQHDKFQLYFEQKGNKYQNDINQNKLNYEFINLQQVAKIINLFQKNRQMLSEAHNFIKKNNK